MIVYGDPSTQESFATLVARLVGRNPVRSEDSRDDARVRLIFAGQLEQGVEDAGLADHAAACRTSTDRFATAFLRDECVEAEGMDAPSDAILTIKLPEGFAFYGLYPEAYAVAVDRWLATLSSSPPKVAVIGIRSIGTTLSAVVKAALLSKGIEAFRLTVRPTGHPFAREAALPPIDADYALVVDEGPGLSGSSMASVAEALVRNGFPKGRIVFFPGHGGDPGAQASESVRAWWRETPRFAVPTEELRWNGLTLEATLAARTSGAIRVDELTGGRWREEIGADPEGWPSVVLPLERRKLRVICEGDLRVLWKFVGLSVPDTVLGFFPSPWVEGVSPWHGRPPNRVFPKPSPVPAIAARILEAAGPPLGFHEAQASRSRLEEMLVVNAHEVGLNYKPAAFVYVETPSAGDYRLAPWEWRWVTDVEGETALRDGNRDLGSRERVDRLIKVSRIAPTLDHTIVGRQPLAWDVAGAMVEWGLNDPTGLPEVPDLDFYRAAYAAFRMGQCLMFADDSEEGQRLRRDAEFYKEALTSL